MADLPQRLQPGDNVVDALNYTLDALDSENRTKLIKNQGVNQVVFGYLAGGFNGQDYGLKISKINPATGQPYDVTVATDDQLVFSSGFDTLRVRTSGTLSITVPVSGSTSQYEAHATLAHGLTYTPAILGFVSIDLDDDMVGTFWVQTPYYTRGGGTEFSMLADSTNIYARLVVDQQVAFSGDTINYRYYILQESAT